MTKITLFAATLLTFAGISVGPVCADPGFQLQIGGPTDEVHDRCDRGQHYSQDARRCVWNREPHRDDQHRDDQRHDDDHDQVRIDR